MTSIWNHLQGVEFKQTFYDAGGVRTRAIEAGAGPVLVLLHGTGGHAEAYLKNIEAHAEHFHVYAIDMVGHGYTDAPDISYDMQCYVDFMIGLSRRHRRGAGPYLRGILRGHGGGLVRLATPGAGWQDRDEHGHDVAAGGGRRGGTARPVGTQAARPRAPPTARPCRSRIRWLMHSDDDVTDEIVETRHRIYQQPGRAAVIRKIAEQSIGAILDPVEQQKWYKPELLERLSCPTLVLWTRHNPGQLVPLAEQGAALIPRQRAGHPGTLRPLAPVGRAGGLQQGAPRLSAQMSRPPRRVALRAAPTAASHE